MGGLFSTPPPIGNGVPDIPVPDFTSTARQFTQGQLASGYWDDFIAKLWASFVKGLGVVLAFLVGGLDDILAFIVTIMLKAQGIDQPGFFSMVAAIMGDLLGVDFSSAAFQSAFQSHGRVAAVEAYGATFYDFLAGEFTAGLPGGSLQPTDLPAKSFLGFLIEFAVRQGNIAFIAGLIPEEFNIMQGLRDYGENLARSLGLGRLARRALQPMVQTLIADPLQWQLNKTYRPKLLGPAELVRAYYRGQLSNADANEYLAREGYPDWAIGSLFADYGKLWTVPELLSLRRMAVFSDDDCTAALVKTGMTLDDATRLWNATKFQAAEPLTHRYISELYTQVHAGLITNPDAQAIISTLPLLPEELQGWQHIFGQMIENNRKLLTEGEIEKAYLEGIIDLNTAQAHWSGVGFSPDAVNTLTFLLLQRQAAGNKTAAGHQPHKRLTEAQLEKAYKSGVIDLPQLQAGWTALGYSQADQQVLTLLVEQKLPGPGSTELPGLTTP